MADVEASVEISVSGAGSLEEAAEAARNLASALKDAEESAASIGGAFESAARSLSSLRDDAEEAAQALKSIRDAGAGLGAIAGDAETAAEGLAQMRDDASEAEAAVESLAAQGADLGDIGAAAGADATALGHLRDEVAETEAAVDSLAASGAGLAAGSAPAAATAAAVGRLRDDAAEATEALNATTAAGGGLADVAATAEAGARGVQALKAQAEEAEEAVDGLAASATGMADIVAGAGEGASALAEIREEADEATSAVEALSAAGAGLAGDAGAAGAYAESLGRVRDEAAGAAVAEEALADAQGRSRDATAGQAAELPFAADQYDKMADAVQAAKQRYAEAAISLSDEGDAAKKAQADMDALAESLRTSGPAETSGLGLGADAGDAIADYKKNLGSLRDTLDEVDKSIDGQASAWKDSGDAADEAAAKGEQYKNDMLGAQAALENFFSAQEQAKSGDFEDLQNFGQATSELRGQLEKASASGEDFADSFGDVDSAVSDASSTIGDFAPVAGDAAAAGEDAGSAFGGLGASAGSAVAGMGPMAGLIGGLAVAATGVVPAVAAATSGLVGFGLLGAPALEKVKAGYTAVTTAQQAYQQAVLVEKNDPTKDNLTAQKAALASLKATWQQMPAPIANSVSAIQQFGHEFSKVSKDSGIQKDVLGDIPKAIKVATDALPSLSSLAKSTAPVVSGMFKDLDKDVQSPAFKNFMKSIDSDVQPASSALHKLAGAAGGFISTLQEKGAGASNQFVSTLSTLIKTATPEAVSGLVNGVKAVTSAMKGMNSAMNSPGTKKAGDIADDVWHGLSVGMHDAMKFNTETGNWLGRMMTGQEKLPAWNAKFGQTTVSPKVDVKPQYHVDPGSMKAALTHPAAAKVTVRAEAKVDKTSTTGLMGQLEKILGESGKGGKAVQVPIEAKVSKVDTSGLKDGDIKVPVTAKIDKVDTSAAVRATSPVKLSGATLDLSSVKIGDLGAVSSSLSSAGSQAGRSFDTGLAAGISAGAGAATAGAQHVVTEIKSALTTLGAAGSAAGAALGAGLASGIAASTGAAVAAATTMANEVTAAVKAAHATRSPSKVFEAIGSDDVKGLIQGLEGGKSQLATAAKDMAAGVTAPFKDTEITDTVTKLETDLKDALKAGDISKTDETGVSAWLTADNKRLMSLAQQRKTIESDIQAADALYKSVDTAAVQGANVVTFAGNVTSAASGGTSSSSSGTSVPADQNAQTPQQIAQAANMAQSMSGSATPVKIPQSLLAPTITSQLKQYLDQTRQFTGDIKKLKSEGLDSTSLQQLLQAGVSGGGLSTSKMMLSGGPQGVKEIASLQNQISQAAKQLGVTGANAAYESGSQIGGGLASGLKAELGSVTDAIKSLATSIVDEMSKGLSSAALENIGKDWASQIAKGMAGGGSSTSGGGGGSAHAAPVLAAAGGGGGGTVHIHTHLDVGGTEIAQTVQTYTLQHARRNTGSGLQLKGRGT